MSAKSEKAVKVVDKSILEVLTAEGFASFVKADRIAVWADFVVERLEHAGMIKS